MSLNQKLEEEIDKLVEQKLDEKEVGGDREELKEEIREEVIESLEEKSEKDKRSLIAGLKTSSISRRDFLKTLGLGAGGLALASSGAASWAKWTPLSDGTSDIDADTVDGNEASNLGKVNPKIEKVASAQPTLTTTSDSTTTSYTVANVGDSVSGSAYIMGKVYNGEGFSWPGTMKLKSEGSTVKSKTLSFQSYSSHFITATTSWTGGTKFEMEVHEDNNQFVAEQTHYLYFIG